MVVPYSNTAAFMRILEQIVLVAQQDNDPDISLLSGRGGHLLLYAYLSEYLDKPELLDDAVETLNYCLEHVGTHQDSMPQLYTYSNGIVGLAWAVQHLIRQKMLPEDASEILDGIDEHLLTFLEHDITRNNFDPLHGYVGKGAYFIERYPAQIALQGLERIVSELAATAKKFKDYLGWGTFDADSRPGEIRCNCGLAHGSAGIISFLCQVYALGLCQDQVRDLLEGAVRGLFYYCASNETTDYIFPDFLLEYPASEHTIMIRTTRLGWCYGDLSTGKAILQAARILDKPEWIEQVRAVVLHHCNKLPDKTNIFSNQDAGVIDTTFCHGVMGIAYLFQLLGQELGDLAIKQAAEQWLQMGITEVEQRLQNGDLRSVYNGKLQDSGILNGYAGIAMVLMSSTKPGIQAWGRCLFLY